MKAKDLRETYLEEMFEKYRTRQKSRGFRSIEYDRAKKESSHLQRDTISLL
jgi:hypothetical protein